jgi:hypothetical protein
VGKWKYDYHLSNAARSTPLEELGRVKAEHRIEECLKRGKSEAGLARISHQGSGIGLPCVS